MPRRLLLIGILGILLIGGVLAGVRLDHPAASRPALQPAPAAAPVLPTATSRHAADLSAAFVAISDAVTPAVVRIQAERSMPARRAWLRGMPGDDGPGASVPEVAGGSGILLSADGYILTNEHVIDGATRIAVTLRDKRTYEARVVGRDPSTDLAVLHVPATDLPSVELGDSESTRVGEWVLAIGHPGFDDASTLDFTVTSGIISAKGRPLNIVAAGGDGPRPGVFPIEDFLQTDAVINPGSSGGPLVNLAGAVIGVNTAIATTTGFHQGYGFAIPSNLARRVSHDLIAYGHVRRALLGVTIADVTPEDAEVYGLERITGVLVEDLGADSPARHAGLERHDVILSVDGIAIERVGHLQRLLALREPGEQVSLGIMRYGVARQVSLRLSQAPRAEPVLVASDRAAGSPADRLGIEVSELSPAVARELGFARSGGALISSISESSPADRKGVAIGHRLLSIDRRAVKSAREARLQLGATRPGAVVSLLIETPDGRTYIANLRVP